MDHRGSGRAGLRGAGRSRGGHAPGPRRDGPHRLALRRATWPLERRGWARLVASSVEPSPRLLDRLLRRYLVRSLRIWIRFHQMRDSLPFVIERGVQMGLPVVAVFVATVPIWGMSWYFNSENWAASVYNSWAEHRTDTWRVAMTRAVLASTAPQRIRRRARDRAAGNRRRLRVPGDRRPGRGRRLAARPARSDHPGRHSADVRFMVISSDVIYPTGAMKDYEANFWLPFKGFDKPVYAIPGNHDWYDALEGFVATFFTPEAARVAMRARVEADNRLTSTTDDRIGWLIGEAARLRREYGMPTGFQRAPYFQIQTDRFALIAVDTGVLRRVDADQLAWLRAALEQSRGKFTMVDPRTSAVCGRELPGRRRSGLHRSPRAHARVQGRDRDGRRHARPRALRRALSGRGSGPRDVPRGQRRRGRLPLVGDGAGVAGFTRRAAVGVSPEHRGSDREDRLSHTPGWKWPFWVWTKQFGAWPFSVEWLSAAFDYNVAPFFQSFVEVRVEPSAGRVRMLPWGVHGRLRWSDLQASPGWRPEGRAAGRAGRDRGAHAHTGAGRVFSSVAVRRRTARRRDPARRRLFGQRVQRVHRDQDLRWRTELAEPAAVDLYDLTRPVEAGQDAVDGQPERRVSAPHHEAVGLIG